MFFFQRGAKSKNLTEGKRIAVHLPGGFRQLMRLVHNEDMVLFQQRPVLLSAAHGVGKKIIVVANLNVEFFPPCRRQILLIPAPVIMSTPI